MTTSPPTSVTTCVEVQAPRARAFHVFTADIGTWWDTDKHILAAPLAEMVFEPFVGGHIIDRGTDGSECRWARVLAFEPPHRVVFSWDINTRWQIETDPAKTSEVEITFEEDGPGRTRVLLTHRHLDRHGEGWEGMRDAVRAGWDLTNFAAASAPLDGQSPMFFSIHTIDGNPDRLLAAKRDHMDPVVSRLAPQHGAVASITVPTDSGITVYNLWRTAEGAAAFTQEPEALAAQRASGLPKPSTFHRHLAAEITIY